MIQQNWGGYIIAMLALPINLLNSSNQTIKSSKMWRIVCHILSCNHHDLFLSNISTIFKNGFPYSSPHSFFQEKFWQKTCNDYAVKYSTWVLILMKAILMEEARVEILQGLEGRLSPPLHRNSAPLGLPIWVLQVSQILTGLCSLGFYRPLRYPLTVFLWCLSLLP